jgi:hypothetical protein
LYATNRIYPYPYILPESVSTVADDASVSSLRADYFEDIWSSAIESWADSWKRARADAPPGSIIQMEICCFYPQGVIFRGPAENDDKAIEIYGLADYEECRRAFGASQLYPGHKGRLLVVNLDDRNQWLLVEPLTLSQHAIGVTWRDADERPFQR